MNNVEKKWYVTCKEIIPLLITLGVVLEPWLDNASEAAIIAYGVLFGLCFLIYIIGGIYFISKRQTTFNSYVSFTKRSFIVETILCLFGVVLASIMNDHMQYYILALWYGIGLMDVFTPSRRTQNQK